MHWVESWHDWEHAARLATRPDPLFKYPLFAASHALPEIVTALMVAAGVVGLGFGLVVLGVVGLDFGLVSLGVMGLGLGVVGAVVAGTWNLTVVAPASVFKFGHVVLKWLHHSEEE